MNTIGDVTNRLFVMCGGVARYGSPWFDYSMGWHLGILQRMTLVMQPWHRWLSIGQSRQCSSWLNRPSRRSG